MKKSEPSPTSFIHSFFRPVTCLWPSRTARLCSNLSTAMACGIRKLSANIASPSISTQPYVFIFIHHNMVEKKTNIKNAQRRRKHCALAEVRQSQKFSPRRRPLPAGAREGQNLISSRWSLPLSTNPVWWGSMRAISSYRGNRPTQKHTHPHTNKQTGPITIHCAAASA